MTAEQITVSIITMMLIPFALWYFQRVVAKRDERKSREIEAENNIVNVKLDAMARNMDSNNSSITQAMLEFRTDVRADIKTLHTRVGDFKESNETAHKEIWTETNRLRERVTGIEAKHEVIFNRLRGE